MSTEAPRILIVDDEEDLLDELRDTLQRKGYRVEAATSAAAAFDVLEHQRFDLIITDVRMPGQDGIAMVQQVGRSDSGQRVILITGHWQDSLEETIPGMAAMVLKKPFTISQLIGAIETMFRPRPGGR